ncbi:hypothetical protein Btru_051777 [Bulinus truncatus]|nr:hypothetical protein Btru_051777 [Bulinus truncatus]
MENVELFLLMLLSSHVTLLEAWRRDDFVNIILSEYKVLDQASQADTNRDGVVTDSEFNNNLYKMADIQGNRDDEVSRDELIDYYRMYYNISSELATIMFDQLNDQKQPDDVINNRDVSLVSLTGKNYISVNEYRNVLEEWIGQSAVQLFTQLMSPTLMASGNKLEMTFANYVNNVDVNNDRVITLYELTQEISRLNTAGGPVRRRDWVQRDTQTYSADPVAANLVFDFWDRDGDSTLSPSDLQSIFRESDVNEDGTVSTDEFLRFIERRKLSRKFGVHGIPRLVLLDGETGRVITRDGYDKLTEDSTGSGFPWRRKSLHDVIKGTLLQAVNGSEVPQEVDATSALEGEKLIGFYFSAHWCLPCRYFDPELVRAYQLLRSRGERFQIVFVSADRSEEAFQRHVAGLPWLTIPYEDPRNQAVKKYLGVDGIPMLVVVDDKGNTITMNGRQALTDDPQCQEFPWHPRPIEDLTPLSSLHLNENMCVIYFTDGTEAGIKQGRLVLSEAANKEAEKGDERDLFFFVAGDDEFSDNVRDFADLDDTCPLLVILDSPEQNVYVYNEVKVTSKIAAEFIDKFLRGELTPTPIPPLCAEGNVNEATAVS